MSPIKLRAWVPRNTKPTYDWKARDSEELRHFDVAFAIKEDVQNIGGQILKDLQTREWSNWAREDYQEKTVDERNERKRSLIEIYPGLFTGPHGVSLKHKDCLPLYILSAKIEVPNKTDFIAAIVVWSTADTTKRAMNGISFFNNHLDSHATFDSFAVDGYSTSRANTWAVGEKGKGFILATQFLFENVEKPELPEPKVGIPHPGVSFRVGEQIGQLKWKKSRRAEEEDSLRLVLDDLTTRTVPEYLQHRYLLDIDLAPDGGDPDYYNIHLETAKMREKAATVLAQAKKQRVTYGLAGPDGTSLVKNDEVCITIMGLDPALKPEYLFSAIYGIIPPPQQWRLPEKNVQFFLLSPNQSPRFYHRDQLVPHSPTRLKTVSINYHGDLTLTSERIMVQNDWRMSRYRADLRVSIDAAMRTLPDLAVELAHDILANDHSDAFAGVLLPRDKAGAVEYRAAFETAIHRRFPSIPNTARLQPATKDEEHLSLFKELDLEPFKVTHRVLEILHTSGAYVPVKEFARTSLLASPIADDVKGLDQLRAAIKILIPNMPSESITARQYNKTYPIAVWDNENKLFACALPRPCDDHPGEECLCWIGPALQAAAKDFQGKKIHPKTIFRAYLSCMGGGDTTMKAIPPAEPMAVDKTPVAQQAATPTAAHGHSRSTTSKPGEQCKCSKCVAASQAPTTNGSANPKPTVSPSKTTTVSPSKTTNGPTSQPQNTTAPVPATNQATAQNGGTVPANHAQRSATTEPRVHPNSDQEAVLNQQAVDRIIQVMSSYEALRREIDDLKAASAAKDGRIARLEEENKGLHEDKDLFDGVAALMEKRQFKRQRGQ